MKEVISLQICASSVFVSINTIYSVEQKLAYYRFVAGGLCQKKAAVI